MSCDVTLAMIKPDAVMAGNSGRIITAIENSSLVIISIKVMRLSAGQAELFYSAHRDKAVFYGFGRIYDIWSEHYSGTEGKRCSKHLEKDDRTHRSRIG